MGPLRNKSVFVRLEEDTYLRLRRYSLRSSVPTSASCLPSFTAGSKSKETGKGRLCPIGKAPDATGNRSFSVKEVRLEWRR
jgi:hypothetical protein